MSVKQKIFQWINCEFHQICWFDIQFNKVVWLYSYIETIKISPYTFTSAFPPTFKWSGRNMVIDNSMFKNIQDFSFNFVAVSQFDLFRY